MDEPTFIRRLLADVGLPDPLEVGHVEVRRITLGPDVPTGAHVHNGPVFGVIQSGSVKFLAWFPLPIRTAGSLTPL